MGFTNFTDLISGQIGYALGERVGLSPQML